MNSARDILFFFPSKAVSLRDRTRLKKFLCTLAKKEKKQIESLNIIFCGDKQLLEINQSFLKHNTYTDIITFDLSPREDGPLSGEIYISAERVRENAKIFKTTINHELHRVIFHGILHLCGYGDKKPANIKQMRAKEDFYLKLYFGD